MKIEYFNQTKTKVGHQTKIIIASTHLLKLLKKISNVLKLSNLNNDIQTSIRVKKELKKLKNYRKGKISS